MPSHRENGKLVVERLKNLASRGDIAHEDLKLFNKDIGVIEQLLTALEASEARVECLTKQIDRHKEDALDREAKLEVAERERDDARQERDSYIQSYGMACQERETFRADFQTSNAALADAQDMIRDLRARCEELTERLKKYESDL